MELEAFKVPQTCQKTTFAAFIYFLFQRIPSGNIESKVNFFDSIKTLGPEVKILRILSKKGNYRAEMKNKCIILARPGNIDWKLLPARASIKIWMLKKRNGACWLVNWLTSYYRKDLIKAVKVIRASIFTSPIWMLQLLFGLANNPI